MITGLDHIAIAVPDLEAAIQRFLNDFQQPLAGCENVESAHTSTAFFPQQNVSIELVHPLNGQGPIAKYLDKRGGGLHHLCFRSDDLTADVAMLKQKGYQFLTDEPYTGAHNCQVIFIHPRCCDGVLIELSEQPEKG